MIVETGWGSMVPTVVIAHMDNKGVAAKSGQLNVGNQILSVNGQSLVGLPLLECQNILRVCDQSCFIFYQFLLFFSLIFLSIQLVDVCFWIK